VSDVASQRSLAADRKVAELVAIGAAVGSGCEACFRSHFEMARTVGLTNNEIAHAVSVAQAVRETSGGRMLELAGRKLETSPSAFATTADPAVADVAPDPASAACC
jgi:AhpD family alkylhydroperoxidase